MLRLTSCLSYLKQQINISLLPEKEIRPYMLFGNYVSIYLNKNDINLNENVVMRAISTFYFPFRNFCFVWVEALRPSQQFFSHVGTDPSLPGYYQCFLGGKCILLNDATRRPE